MEGNKQVLYDAEFRAAPSQSHYNVSYLRDQYGAKILDSPRHLAIYNLSKEKLDHILKDEQIKRSGYTAFTYIAYPPEMSFRKSSNYREKYIQKNPPFYKGGYRCTYCGRFVSKENMQVDHIVSVTQGKMSVSMQNKFYRKGWKGINDERNLTCSCAACNDYKSSKGGIWVLRGMLRKHKWYWPLRRIIETMLLAAVLYIFRNQIWDFVVLVYNDYLAHLPK